MGISSKILTEAGLTKIPLDFSHALPHKIRLYSFFTQTQDTLTKVQKALQQQLNKGRSYEGNIHQLGEDIQVKPYLLKTENCLKLISEEDVFQLQQGISYSVDIEQSVVQDAANQQKEGSIQHSDPVNHLDESVLQSLVEIYKTISNYEKILKIALELKNQIVAGITYYSLGKAYAALGEYHKAISYYKNVLRIALELKYQAGEMIAYHNLGAAYHKLGIYPEACSYYKKYLKNALELKDRIIEGKAYCILGDAYQKLGKYHKAISCHEEHLKIALEFKDQVGERMAYGNLGIAYGCLGEVCTAISYHEKCLKIMLQLKDKVGEGKVYNNLGIAHQELGEVREAIHYYENALEVMLELKNQAGEGAVYGNLGRAYTKLGEIHTAISYYKKVLNIMLELKNQVEEGMTYCNLGIAYQELGETYTAVSYHKKSLKIAIELKDRVGKERAYSNLGNAYGYLGKYYKAISYHEEALKIALELKNQVGAGLTYGNLGIVYGYLGEHRKAISYHKESLKIAIALQDQIGKGRVYCNLGNTYRSIGEYHKAIEFHNKYLEIALELQDQVGTGKAYSNLGIAYQELGETYTAISYHKESLKIALKLKDLLGEERSYCNLGVAYNELGKASKAINYYEKCLKIVLELKDQVGESKAYCNFGAIYWELGEYSLAEDYFRKSIKITTSLQQNAKETQWQITVFEELSKPYIGLEWVLLLQNKNAEALEISDMRRSRALSSLLSQKYILKENKDSSLSPLSIAEIQKLAENLSTNFVVYSFVRLNAKEKNIQAWVISSKGKPPQIVLLPIPKEIFSELKLAFKAFPYQPGTRPKRGEKNPSQLFNEKLSSCYETLIAPLEEYLPLPGSDEILTFIPDGFLAHLPFGAFYSKAKGKYLIEEYPISVAPSIQVLSLLNQLPKDTSSQALLMGNPTTFHGESDQLEHAEREVRDIIAPMMKNLESKLFIQKEATGDNVFEHAPNAQIIHIACHGIAEKKPQADPHSVFEGYFKLAPDQKYPTGELHAKDVNSLALKADLVFMSACHLGRGNLQKEGSIGPIWSFLGSGAKSTIASYWPLPEGDTTVKMVETFYQHYLGVGALRLNKAKALQQAVLMAMKTERDKPRQWGSFFLSGLIE